jgi:hypothetical protein
MADLTGTTPAATYKGLLQVNDYTDGVANNTGSSALAIQDGAGNATALAVSTDNVGIGTTSPDAKLDVYKNFVGLSDVTAAVLGGDDGAVGFCGIKVMSKDNQSIQGSGSQTLSVISNNTTDFVVTGNGNVGIGTTSFGTNAAGVIGIGNGTAPTTAPVDMVQLYAKDDAGSSALYVRNEANTETILSPHAADAPSSLYDRPPGVEEMHRSANYYLGTIVFTNVDRRNALLQKQLNGEELPEDRTFTVIETFAEYNARTGADLQVEDWDANQQAMFDAQEEKVAARQAEIDAWDNEEEEAPEPLQSYVKKPKPDWLS